MKPFADLVDRLLYSPSHNAKLALLFDYFARTPDPDRGLGLAILTGNLDLKHFRLAALRKLAERRVDPVLFRLSYDFVGDLAETVALIWPDGSSNQPWPRLADVHRQLIDAPKTDLPDLIAGWLDTLDATGRWALLKLLTGNMRVGISGRLAKLALAKMGRVEASEVEEVWHGIKLPYEDLFGWLEGRVARPNVDDHPLFRPLMLANSLSEKGLRHLDLSEYAVEWKWDGVRVQLSARAGERRLYSRSGDDISHAFPEIIEAMSFDGVLDGELLLLQGRGVASFNELQHRLNRKRITPRALKEHPAHVWLYDLLFDGLEDLRGQSYEARRGRLEAFFDRVVPERMDLSPLIAVKGFPSLAILHESCRERGLEGLMLKRRKSVYVAGRPAGSWYKWKRDPLTLDTVLMYAQRGHGARSSLYSDFTLGAWCVGEEGRELVPVGKTNLGFTNKELRMLDKWVRDHTVQRFGPVREVKKILVIEAAFDSVCKSSRHKSGISMRFPRLHRIRWDKSAEEADELGALRSWLK